MNPQLSQQELAALIEREGLAFEIRSIVAPWHGWCPGEGRARWIDRLAYEIRLAPGALNEWNLPHGTEPHNPDGLTPEQITEGGKWRAVTLEECDGRHRGTVEVWDCGWCVTTYGNHNFQTYRVPITTPLPSVKEPQPATGQSKTPRTISEYFGQPEGSFKALIQQHEASGYSPEEIALMGGITGVLKSRKEQVESLQTKLTAALAQRDEARRLLGEARRVMQGIYDDTEGYADGAPDASAHDRLCNEISGKLRQPLNQITNHLKTA